MIEFPTLMSFSILFFLPFFSFFSSILFSITKSQDLVHRRTLDLFSKSFHRDHFTGRMRKCEKEKNFRYSDLTASLLLWTTSPRVRHRAREGEGGRCREGECESNGSKIGPSSVCTGEEPAPGL